MTDDKYRAPESGTVEGRLFTPHSEQELAEAIELAFDYRGDVTIQLKDGTTVEGYLFNRTPTAIPPLIELFQKGHPDVRILRYSEISAIAFTGNDTASGKSWEAWVTKKDSQRRAEAERVIAEAKARGHL
jgi:hypothetical protein